MPNVLEPMCFMLMISFQGTFSFNQRNSIIKPSSTRSISDQLPEKETEPKIKTKGTDNIAAKYSAKELKSPGDWVNRNNTKIGNDKIAKKLQRFLANLILFG